MVFSSAIFLFYFLPAFLFVYYVTPWKNATLLLGSLIFYAWGEPRFVPLLMLSALLNYVFGVLIGRAGATRRPLLALGISANLGLLLYYKYAAFLVDISNQVFGRHANLPAIVLPLGISFFTFQGLSYLIDVYRGHVDSQKSFLNFAMYKAMFPQLIAGPIVRYQQIAAEIEHRHIDNVRLSLGFRLFVLGLAQKVLIANAVGLPADTLFGVGPAHLDAASAWLAVACYSIQILFDFAGYSNMAIGIGHMLGFSYPPNFDRPYSARSITEFWRRWHISLSSWFRDYVYIPLGGNRGGSLRTYVNLSIVFLLCGLWHGAAWTFIIWGAWHGALLVAERAGLGALMQRLPALAAQAITLLCVMLGWVFFRASDVPSALAFIKTMFGFGSVATQLHPWQMDVGAAQWSTLAIGTILALWSEPLERAMARALPAPLRSFKLKGAAVLVAYLACIATLAVGTYNPFIYFHF
ncbi:MAG: MBOAT family protein [Pseudomonadota bacterium]